MKFGKTYMETLESYSFPQEWRSGAIEYKQLKKIINGVVAELEELGLGAEVLRELMSEARSRVEVEGFSASEPSRGSTVGGKGKQRADSPPATGVDKACDDGRRPDPAGGRRRSSSFSPPSSSKAQHDAPGTGRRHISVSPSAERTRRLEGEDTVEERVVEPGDGWKWSETFSPGGVVISSSEDEREEGPPNEVRGQGSSPSVGGRRRRRGKRHSSLRRRARTAKAEYELGGTAEHPIPRIRLTIESPLVSDSSDIELGDTPDDSDGDEVRSAGDSTVNANAATVGIQGYRQDGGGSSTILTSDTVGNGSEAMEQANADPTADVEVELRSLPVHKREILIPLSRDTEFLTMLTSALNTLSTLQRSQFNNFTASVEELSASVTKVSSPYNHKSDLYVWREVFTLWVESAIFEGLSERDRGERTLADAEARLEKFVNTLKQRGYVGPGSERKLHEPGSRAAMTEFLHLNHALMDVKKFQLVNVEAARKILKKHDKRTALTATRGFRKFIVEGGGADGVGALVPVGGEAGTSRELELAVVPSRVSSAPSTLASSISLNDGTPSNSLRLSILSTSLPHVLVTLLTSTLVPILPSIDDFSCLICTEVAYIPVRLRCGHLFCIRCLVKLQKRHKPDCPMCRERGAVAQAGANNVDSATLQFMKLWFPREVKEKRRENEKDRSQEEMVEMGVENRCVVC